MNKFCFNKQLATLVMSVSLVSSVVGRQSTVTDVYHALPMGSSQLSGELDNAVRFVQDHEIKNINWVRYVDQFRDKTEWGNSWYGEFWGKVMRGACLTYEYTQDPELYSQLDAAVRDLLSTQDSVTGRISSFPDNLELQYWDVWCQKYVLLGFQYFYDICNDPELKTQIVTALIKEADYLLSKIGPGKPYSIVGLPHIQMKGLTESSILEPMVKLYNMTGNQRYFDFATYIVNTGGTIDSQNNPDRSIFEMAKAGTVLPAQYPHTHAYALMSLFEGLIEYYKVTGDAQWLTAINNFYHLIRQHEVTITGGIGFANIGEDFGNGATEQTNLAKINNGMLEYCAAVTWIKFSDNVLRLTGNPACVDEIEKTAYNALLGAIDFGKHPGYYTFAQYTQLINGYRGHTPGSKTNTTWPNSCCNANGPTGTGILPKINMMTSQKGFAMNLYMPGTVTVNAPSGGAVRFVTATDYPYDGTVKITVNPTKKKESFDLELRIPAWNEAGKVAVYLNGGSPTYPQPGSFHKISRKWSKGDVITIDFDMRTQVVIAPDGKGEFEGLRRGPIVMSLDARFAEEFHNKKIARDANGYIAATLSKNNKFANRLELLIPVTSGNPFHVCDHASSGSTWSKESLYAVWIYKNELGGNMVSAIWKP